MKTFGWIFYWNLFLPNVFHVKALRQNELFWAGYVSSISRMFSDMTKFVLRSSSFSKEKQIQSNLVIKNFWVTLKLFLNAKCSLSLWSKLTIGHGKWFLNTNLFLIQTFLITKFDCTRIPWILRGNLRILLWLRWFQIAVSGTVFFRLQFNFPFFILTYLCLLYLDIHISLFSLLVLFSFQSWSNFGFFIFFYSWSS
jgi:hypothetical protein